MSQNSRILSRALLNRASYAVLALAAVSAIGGAAYAQDVDAGDDAVSEVVVRGYRAGLQSALNLKRDSSVMVDAINAEDIADFPDANLAESLQRLPGVSIDRDNGEGRTITVRGLGPDFTRVRLNGLETVSTTGSSDAGTSPNRGRGFDFNTFASELFSSLRVQKTASAETDEGSLGATVDLITGRPFTYRGRRVALSLQNDHFENGGYNSPRIAGLISNTWFDNRLGAAFSLAYNERTTQIDSYARSGGQADYAYRNTTFFYPTIAGGTTNFPVRQGFAAPQNAPCNGVVGATFNSLNPATYDPNAVIPGLNITNNNPLNPNNACDTLRGSNPAAYALVMGTGVARVRTPGTAAVTGGNFNQITVETPSSLVRVPALASLNQNIAEQERLGMTLALQVRPTDRTLVSLDGVYSRFKSNTQNFGISSIGLNRSNINGGAGNLAYLTATGQVSAATAQGAYTACTEVTNPTGTATPVDCGRSVYGNTLVPGTVISRNPFNLEQYDYYNSPGSVFVRQPGYVSDPTGIQGRDLLIGRQSTVIVDAALSETGANADYLVLGNLDLRSNDDQSISSTEFHQYSLNIEHEFTDRLRLLAVLGASESDYQQDGILTDFIRLDSGRTLPNSTTLVNPANGYYVFDERGDGPMPLINYGFDAADPASWDTVKGYSVFRLIKRGTNNQFETARFDFTYDVTDDVALKFGVTRRVFSFTTFQTQRGANEVFNPTLLEAGKTVADVSRVINFGVGLDLPVGSTTSFIAPDNAKMNEIFDFTCNCINKWGDFRLTDRATLANSFGVDETDTSGYLQLDFRNELWGRRLYGNMGFRFANTFVESSGFTNAGRPVSAENEYNDILPSFNAAYELRDDLILRVGLAKVMARPLLGNMAPSVTQLTVPTGAGVTSGGTITIGNPYIDPFRATNYDLSLEWYFAPGGLLSVAVFDKKIGNNPQTVLTETSLQSILEPDVVAEIIAAQTAAGAAYITAGNSFIFRQFQNSPGGYIRGVELSYQQELSFLPGFLKNLGIQANYTHLESELTYILRPENPVVLGTAAYTGASPDAFNFTVYYDTDKWSARVSTSYRAEYYTQYPIATGTGAPGFVDGPLVNDFGGSEATTNVDANFTYNLTPQIGIIIEAQNLTNQTSDRFLYAADPVVSRYESSGRIYRAGIKFQY